MHDGLTITIITDHLLPFNTWTYVLTVARHLTVYYRVPRPRRVRVP